MFPLPLPSRPSSRHNPPHSASTMRHYASLVATPFSESSVRPPCSPPARTPPLTQMSPREFKNVAGEVRHSVPLKIKGLESRPQRSREDGKVLLLGIYNTLPRKKRAKAPSDVVLTSSLRCLLTAFVSCPTVPPSLVT